MEKAFGTAIVLYQYHVAATCNLDTKVLDATVDQAIDTITSRWPEVPC